MQKNEKILSEALETEIQAIAIYEMECWIFSLTSWTKRRRSLLQVLKEILQEERSHENHLNDFLRDSPLQWMKAFYLKISGYFLGFLLALVPRPLYFYFHAWAEEQASEIYRQTKMKLGDTDLKLIEVLDEAVVQEANHARRFRAMI